jgi:hypothetical protein
VSENAVKRRTYISTRFLQHRLTVKPTSSAEATHTGLGAVLQGRSDAIDQQRSLVLYIRILFAYNRRKELNIGGYEDQPDWPKRGPSLIHPRYSTVVRLLEA